MISQTAEYAVRAVVYLAGQEGTGCTNRQIAEATGLPADYLAKVMQSLSRAGLVRSRPGRNGGFTLEKKPKQTTFLEIVDAVDPLQKIESCPLGHDYHNHQDGLCPLHSHVNETTSLAENAYRKLTVSDLVKMSKSNDSGCQFPCFSDLLDT